MKEVKVKIGMKNMNKISRLDAEALINEHWSKAQQEADRVGMPTNEYITERMRNYEIEYDLSNIFGGEYVVNEWCPFNGIFCKWMHHCDLSVLNSIVEENRGRGVVDGYNLDHLADYAESEIKKRFEENL